MNLSRSNNTPHDTAKLLDCQNDIFVTRGCASSDNRGILLCSAMALAFTMSSLNCQPSELVKLVKQYDISSTDYQYSDLACENKLILEVKSFTHLPDNWDGYGGIPLLEECYSNFIVLLQNIIPGGISKVDRYYPNNNGTISLIWIKQECELYLEVGKDNYSFYFDNMGEVQYHDNVDIRNIGAFNLSLNQLFQQS